MVSLLNGVQIEKEWIKIVTQISTRFCQKSQRGKQQAQPDVCVKVIVLD